MQRIIEKTEDGSATLFVPELNEHYHSVKGARTEITAHLHRHGTESIRYCPPAYP